MGPRGRYAKGVEKRDEILRTALEVFAQEGYRGTTLREVADRCGLSVAGVMHYFSSREDLLTQVVQARDESTGHTLEDTTGSWDDLLAAVRRNTDQPGLVELFVTLTAAARDPAHPAHDVLADRYDRLRAAAVPELRTLQENGTLPSGIAPEALAELVVAVADGAQMQWLVDPTHDLSRPLETLAALLGLPGGADDARARQDRPS